jgi:hypothetical protein
MAWVNCLLLAHCGSVQSRVLVKPREKDPVYVSVSTRGREHRRCRLYTRRLRERKVSMVGTSHTLNRLSWLRARWALKGGTDSALIATTHFTCVADSRGQLTASRRIQSRRRRHLMFAVYGWWMTARNVPIQGRFFSRFVRTVVAASLHQSLSLLHALVRSTVCSIPLYSQTLLSKLQPLRDSTAHTLHKSQPHLL